MKPIYKYILGIFIMADAWTTVTTKRKRDEKKTPCIEIIKKAKDPIELIHPLNDTWVCWYHILESDNWDISCYQTLLIFNTAEDFWILMNNISNVNNGMYYIMRQGYPPMWDHEANLEGGGWTFKIDKKFAQEFWTKLACFCVGETLSLHPNNITGISISPKVRFVTFRIWTKNTNRDPTEFNNIKKETENDSLSINFENARFVPNSDALR